MAAIAGVLLLPSSAHGAWETLKLIGSKELRPGGFVSLKGHSWYGPASNCKNRVAITLVDSGGRRHRLGKLGPSNTAAFGMGAQDVQNFWSIAGYLRVPAGGVRPGPARLLALQRVRFRLPLPGFPCIQVARKQARISGLTVTGVSGDDPPEITGLAAADVRQGHVDADAVTWRQSEPAHALLDLSFLFSSRLELAAGTLLDGDRPAGQNSVAWDGTIGGVPLPVGRYRVGLVLRDASGARSAPAFDELVVGPG